ncbi:MAG: GIY-YIG nuclease family protein [Candidatus Kaiserbacteria bacterium]|nr:GIY-YIG nuclease family protein [Candidatus Kaiserbacteria bacterium]
MEVVYILTNESMPEVVKIGRTARTAGIRAREIDNTSVPTPFEIHYATEVEDSQQEEKWLHDVFADRRVRDNREFFRVDPERVVIALRRIGGRDVTNETVQSNPISEQQEEEVEERKSKRSRFDFDTYDISVGEEIYFSRDESEKATVLEGNKIQWNNEETSLSVSARKLLRNPPYGVNGTLYWMYDGETLDERRRRMDEGETV